MNEPKQLAVGDVITPEMIDIPAGTFLMGSPAGEQGRLDDEVQHAVTVKAFRMARHAVTFEEFDVFARERRIRTPGYFGWENRRCPVLYVSWREAMAYCAWLSENTGQRFRLPTEAEWEYAARAGTTTAYWWGEKYDRSRVRGGSSCAGDDLGAVKIDAYEPNPWGLYNMLGNTWEWTSSAYQEQWDGSEQRCVTEEQGGRRVVRGGSWYSGPGNLRSASRFWYEPDSRYDTVGFRLVQDVQRTSPGCALRAQ